MYEVKTTNQFERDVKRAQKRCKELEKLKLIISELSEGKTLLAKFRDHKLTGNYNSFRECHIEPDWLLIYKIEDNILYLARTGTHSDLFK